MKDFKVINKCSSQQRKHGVTKRPLIFSVKKIQELTPNSLDAAKSVARFLKFEASQIFEIK